MSTSHDDLRRLVDGHFGRGLSPSEEGRLRDHLPACPDCRRAYESYQVAERLDPTAPGSSARLANALGLPPEARIPSRRGWRWAVAIGSVAGAVGVLVALTPFIRSGSSGSEIVPRGQAIARAAPLDVAVFRVKGERDSTRVRDVVSPDDELAFAYRNELGKAFLMIFAVDGAHHVVWYHPAWMDPADDPMAVPITQQIGFRELPEAVRQPLQGPTLTVHALFMDRPLDARTVEARLSRGEPAADATAGEELRTSVFEVRP